MPARWKTNWGLEIGVWGVGLQILEQRLRIKNAEQGSHYQQKNIHVFFPFLSSLFVGQKVTKKPWATGFTSNR
ncbi:hypothetical protein [Algoriphagus lacus]|nr:hypothetical protein [Algoriphagus lacus]